MTVSEKVVDKILNYLDKLFSAVFSTRTQMFVGAVVLILYRKELGLSDAAISSLVQAVLGWIIGTSITPLVSPKKEDPEAPAEVSRGGAFGGPYGRR